MGFALPVQSQRSHSERQMARLTILRAEGQTDIESSTMTDFIAYCPLFTRCPGRYMRLQAARLGHPCRVAERQVMDLRG